MQIALVDGIRCTASPKLSGQCQGCGSTLIPRCGALRAWHWAHRGELYCDRWWERETAWHIAWKNRFPTHWQEIVGSASDGEKHIADVKTPDGRVIEFQHSSLAAEERRAREIFHGSMIWVVDGLARKRDVSSFYKTLYRRNQVVFSGHESECALLRDWLGRRVDVFFDFGLREEDVSAFGGPILWHLHPDPERRIMLTRVPVTAFVAALHNAIAFPRIRLPATVVPWPLYRRRRYPRF